MATNRSEGISMNLILVANPGSSSRKYALYEADGLALHAEIHYEHAHDGIVYTIESPGKTAVTAPADFSVLDESCSHVISTLVTEHLLTENQPILAIGLRVVAPSAFFMQDHVITDEVVARLESIKHLAPLHIGATLSELQLLRAHYPDTPIVGVSDSAFHRTKPNYAWNYGINIHDADRLDIKRFGYHGISVSSVVDELWNRGKLPPKVIVCHLGSGSSVTGVFHGRSIDTTMGFTPNEGVIMATRSGSISPDASHALRSQLQLDDAGLVEYLNTHAGLAGMAESDDIRELLKREADGDHAAHLALTTLIHTIHKAIGSMLVAMNGCDLLVFTGTVGERSAVLRKRIVAHLEFCDFVLDGVLNDECTSPQQFTNISQIARSKPIVVIPAYEALEIARRTKQSASV